MTRIRIWIVEFLTEFYQGSSCCLGGVRCPSASIYLFIYLFTTAATAAAATSTTTTNTTTSSNSSITCLCNRWTTQVHIARRRSWHQSTANTHQYSSLKHHLCTEWLSTLVYRQTSLQMM